MSKLLKMSHWLLCQPTVLCPLSASPAVISNKSFQTFSGLSGRTRRLGQDQVGQTLVINHIEHLVVHSEAAIFSSYNCYLFFHLSCLLPITSWSWCSPCRCSSGSLWMKTLTVTFPSPSSPRRRSKLSSTPAPDSSQSIPSEPVSVSEPISSPADAPRGLGNRLASTRTM